MSHIQDLEFSTDVVGDSRDSAFRILATSATLLAIDDARQENSHSEGNSSHRGVSAWTVGYQDALTNVGAESYFRVQVMRSSLNLLSWTQMLSINFLRVLCGR